MVEVSSHPFCYILLGRSELGPTHIQRGGNFKGVRQGLLGEILESVYPDRVFVFDPVRVFEIHFVFSTCNASEVRPTTFQVLSSHQLVATILDSTIL